MNPRPTLPRRVSPDAPARRGWCPGLARPMPTGDGLLARVHPPLGVLTLTQARAVADGARRFGNGHIDLTARANLQVRGVSEATRDGLARLLEAAGLGDARHDGGPQRLTLTGPLAGLDPAEAIDVPRLARAVEAAGLTVPRLPAKTLVAIEGRPGASAADADILVTTPAPGRVAIALAHGDGARCVAACPEDDAAARVAALLFAFARTGRRRIRDLSPGERAAMAGHLPGPDRLPVSAPDPVGEPAPPPAPVPAAGLARLDAARMILAADAAFGRCTARSLERLIDVAADLGAPEIRLSRGRGFVLAIPDDGRAREALGDLSGDFVVRADDPRRGIDACTGAPACASGTTATLQDAGRIAALTRPLAGTGFEIHVSGCAKGCARPGRADLTLVGHDGLYGTVVGGGPGDRPVLHLPIEAALERIGRAVAVGLAAAFSVDGADAQTIHDGQTVQDHQTIHDHRRDRRPA